ncbi:MAG TPA: glycosyl hydrolase [Stellaceae bacterium]|nr:glycosyl hydrolase [Stellaceae bacterium]
MSVLAWLGLCAAIALPSAAYSAPKTVDNPNGCKIVERSGGAPSGSITSSVTAGGGQVSGSTTGGNGVTVYSHDGNSVATAGTTGGNSSAMVTSGNGDCTIYVAPGTKIER